MKIRKLAALLLALAMALPLWGLAEEIHQFEGYVTQIIDGGFVLEDIQRGQVILNTDDSTVWDGLLIDGELEAGMYVMVDYDGRLTRSIPPQAHADRVGCYTLQGTVSEVAENGLLLTGDERFGDVWVKTNLVDAQHVYPGMTLLVYYDGVMAMSLPGQVTAHQLEIPFLQGTVSDQQADSFLLTTEGGETYRVLLTDETLIGLVSATAEEEAEEMENAEAVEAEAETEAEKPEAAVANGMAAETDVDKAKNAEATSVGGKATEANAEKAEDTEKAASSMAIEADAEKAEGTEKVTGSMATEADEQAEGEAMAEADIPTLDWGNGDAVIVYYSGEAAITHDANDPTSDESTPAQLTALEINVLR